MIEMENPATGSAEGQAGLGARVLREIIRTPAFLQIIKMHARDFDPESAREVVRTFLWEDADLSLSLVGTLPELVNYLSALVLELGRQMNNFPGGLLDQYVSQAVTEIDLETFKEYPEVFGPLLENMRFGEAAAVAVGKTVNTLADTVTRTAARNPDFLKDILGQVDARALLRATLAVVRSAVRWLVSGVRGLMFR
jgi:hypothetical protein